MSHVFPFAFCLFGCLWGVFKAAPPAPPSPCSGCASKRGPAARGICAELGAEIPVFHTESPGKLLHGRAGQGRGRGAPGGTLRCAGKGSARDLRGIFSPAPGTSPPCPGWNPRADLFSIQEPSPEPAAKAILGLRWVLGRGMSNPPVPCAALAPQPSPAAGRSAGIDEP